MSNFKVGCGHIADGHGIVFLTIEGFKEFKSWQWKYGRVTYNKLITGKGVYKDKYLLRDKNDMNYKTICISCLSKWQSTTR